MSHSRCGIDQRVLSFCFLIFLTFLGLLLQYTNYNETSTMYPEVSPETSDEIKSEDENTNDENALIPLDERYIQLNKLPLCGELSRVKISENVLKKIEKVKKEFSKCITPIVKKWKGKPKKMLSSWVAKVFTCDTLSSFKELGVVSFGNAQEDHWAVLPKCKEENVLVTLGVGEDTTAEEKFNRAVPNTTFYGTDPVNEKNRQMYSAFGNFFPFAIGRKPGFTKIPLHQKTKFNDVTTIPFLYFIREILKLKRIDFAWIDIDGGEFEFLDHLHEDVKICQLNIEVHEKEKAQLFHDFIFKVLGNQKYIFMKSKSTETGVHRMFFLNLEDRECVAKFFV